MVLFVVLYSVVLTLSFAHSSQTLAAILRFFYSISFSFIWPCIVLWQCNNSGQSSQKSRKFTLVYLSTDFSPWQPLSGSSHSALSPAKSSVAWRAWQRVAKLRSLGKQSCDWNGYLKIRWDILWYIYNKGYHKIWRDIFWSRYMAISVGQLCQTNKTVYGENNCWVRHWSILISVLALTRNG